MAQAAIAGCLGIAGLLRDQRFERAFPSRAESRDPQRALELIARMSRQIEQRVDVGDLSGPSATFTISSPAPTSPSFSTRK
jgi:hypothetical protein